MTNSNEDYLIEAFISNYGLLNTLEDAGIINFQKTNEDNIVANCPFHEDSQPSFSFNLITSAFLCFACGVSGGLFQFIQLSFNLDYNKTKEYILARSGLNGDINFEDIILRKKNS